MRWRDAAVRDNRTALRWTRHQVLQRQHVPKNYQNLAFIARRGSWNREQKFGYDVVVARTPKRKAKLEPFMTRFLDEKANIFHGRPTYWLPLQDGPLPVSDEQNGAVYRITYQANSAIKLYE